VNPGGFEVPNDCRDNDCDGGQLDDKDDDGDGFYACDDDCDDENSDVFPGAEEACDGIDSDCDGDLPQEERDDDGDGWRGCDGDCEDNNPQVNPGQREECNESVDDDCDGQPARHDEDQDGDGFSECEGDCNDNNPSAYPGSSGDCAGSGGGTPWGDTDPGWAAPGCAVGCSGGGRGGAALWLIALVPLALRRQRGLALALAAMLPAVALADEAPAPETAGPAAPAEDPAALAVRAHAVHEQWCADIAGSDERSIESEGIAEVAPVWRDVSHAWEATEIPFLLYWTGVLELCLDRRERAAEDLAAFVELAADDPTLEPQVAEARRRLRRLDTASRAGRSRAERNRGFSPVSFGLGGGYAAVMPYHYGAVSASLDVRGVGVARFVTQVRLGISEQWKTERGGAVFVGEDGRTWRSVHPTVGLGLMLRWKAPVRPELVILVAAGATPHGLVEGEGELHPPESPVTGGPVLGGGVLIPFGESPLGMRLRGEVGLLIPVGLVARGLAEVVISAPRSR